MNRSSKSPSSLLLVYRLFIYTGKKQLYKEQRLVTGSKLAQNCLHIKCSKYQSFGNDSMQSRCISELHSSLSFIL